MRLQIKKNFDTLELPIICDPEIPFGCICSDLVNEIPSLIYDTNHRTVLY